MTDINDQDPVMTAAAFKRWRHRMGFQKNAQAAGDALGLSKWTIYNYESGRNEIPLTVRLACCALITLGVKDYQGPD